MRWLIKKSIGCCKCIRENGVVYTVFHARDKVRNFMHRRKSRPIWLFGENLGATANNNSFYMWRHIVGRHTNEVAPYLILEKTAANRKVVAKLGAQERRYIVWRHSLTHVLLYLGAEFSFVTLSFRDVQPECVKFCGITMNFKPQARCSLVYLQHGVSGIKALGYGPTYAGGTMLRFVYYNPHICKDFINVNKFRPYQLFHGIYFPRYQELLRRVKAAGAHEGKRVLWFLTWREYMGKNIFTYKFFSKIRKTLESQELRDWLESVNGTLTICLHQLCSTKCAQYMPDVEAACTDRMKIVYASKIDVMDEIVASDILITDYSSLGFDFTFLRRPVLLYAQDLEIYMRERKFYCTREEFEEVAILDRQELIRRLTKGDYPALNPFFASRLEMPDDSVYGKVEAGYYIERMYKHFWKLQNETYAFLGYDFSGVGGTVYATKALADGLLEAGKRVLFCPLKNGGVGSYPPGTVNRPMVDFAHFSMIDRIKCWLHNRAGNYSYLKYDKDMHNLRPYCGWALKRLLKVIRAKAVISTRETMHFFLDDAKSPWIKRKFYYFHCHAGLVDSLFPGTVERLKARSLDTALFVTEKNRRLLDELLGYHHQKHSIVTGNALDSSRMIEEDGIRKVPNKSCFIVATLLRISEERWGDIERALDFARYLKAKGQTRIKINVFGKGSHVLKLQYTLVDEELDSVMAYRGETRDIVATYSKHDAMVDFSQFQSFGMGYIEAVFNGRMPFCRHNEGSDEVLRDLPKCFYETNEELESKILGLPSITVEELRRNYETLAARYSRTAVTRTLLDAPK